MISIHRQTSSTFSRAVILPTPCDPYIMQLWLSSFKQWQRYITKLYVHINTKIDTPVVNFIKNKIESIGGEVIYTSEWMDHGRAIKDTLATVKEKYCLLLEDDLYVLKPNEINLLFSQVEQGPYDLIGSPRGSASAGLIKKEKEVFKTNPLLSDEVNLWPCLIFCASDLLRTTDQHFGPKTFPKGIRIPILDYVPTEDENGDTFVWTSIQLLKQNLRIKLINQMRHTTSGYNFYPPACRMTQLIKEPSWIHTGTSSSGIHGLLLDNENRLLGFRENGKSSGIWKLPSPAPDKGLHNDYLRRVAFWKLCLDSFRINDTEAKYFNELYETALQKATTGLNLEEVGLLKYYSFFAETLKSLLKD